MGTYYKDAMVLSVEKRREYFRSAASLGIAKHLSKQGMAYSMSDLKGLLDELMAELGEGRYPESDALAFGLANAIQYFSFENEEAIYKFIGCNSVESTQI